MANETIDNKVEIEMQSGIKVIADRFIEYAGDKYMFAISNGALLYRSKPTDKYSLLVKEFDKK